MIRNTIKKTAVSLFALFSAILFFSCTFIHDNKSGKVTFSVNNIIQNSSRAVVTISNTDFLEVSLLGDYTATQTVSIKDASTIIFEEVPLEAEIYAEVFIYRINALNKRYDKYSGKSESIIVQEGDNVLTVKLSAINQEENPQEEEKSVYTVKHLMQNIDDDEYTEDVDLRETLEGKASTSTNAKAKTITGFTSKAFEQQTIQSDDSTVIEIYYNRNVHTIKYIGGFDDVTDVPEAKQYRYGATVKLSDTIPVRTGYNFAGWKDASGKVYDAESEITIGDANITLTAQWVVSSGTPYKVKHLKQNIDDDDYTLAETENLAGVTLAQTNAVAKSYEGFTAPATIEQKTIAEDGSTVIEIKYDRRNFTVSYEDAVDGEEISVPVAATYRYEANVDINFTTIGNRTGYTFNGWKDPESGKIYKTGELTSFDMGLADVVLYAQWTANVYTITYELNGGAWAEGYTSTEAYHDTYTYGISTSLPNADKVLLAGYGLMGWYEASDFSDEPITAIAAGRTGNITVYAKWEAGSTSYKIRHFLQKVEGDEYEESSADEQVVGGKSDETTQATDKVTTHTGFTAKTVTEKTILGDGSTIVDVYFNRNVHTVTYEDGMDKVNKYGTSITVEGDIPSAETVRYGATVNVQVNTKPTLDGYRFTGWIDGAGNTYNTESAETSFTMDDSDVTFLALWDPSYADYTIIHRKQNLSDPAVYDETETDTSQSGITGDNTSAEANTYDGFTAKTISQLTIKPDDSTIVYIDYDRNKYTISYEDGVDGVTITVPSDTTEYAFGAEVEVIFTGIGSRTGYTFAGWSTNGTTLTYSSTGTTSFNMSSDNVVLYAIWEVEQQNTEIDVSFGVDDTTITVTESSGVFTASTGYSTYSWTVDGEAADSAYLDSTNPNKLNLSSITVKGVYDITLTATKTVNDNTITHTWTGQYIKS